MNNSIIIKTSVEVDRQRVVDTLINALEGGSHYWIEQYTFKINKDIETVLKMLMNNEASLTIQEDDREETTYQVKGKDFENGLQLMANLYPWHFKNLVDENDDAETADVLLQLATFGELVYG